MRKLILFCVSFFCIIPGVCAQQTGTQTVSNDANVPIEEYVPKVIIEGKWGSAPGEFGRASRFPLGEFEQYIPSSLAVNSKGDIYILDYVNNRIQKFTQDGKYLASISVEGLTGVLAGYCVVDTCYEVPPVPGLKYDRPVMGEIVTVGVNIVIDSKDTLHYYLKRVKDGKETGEVWEFKNDKLVNKGSPNSFRGVQAGIAKEKYVDPKVDAEIKESSIAKNFSAADKKNRQLSFRLDNGEALHGQRRVVYDEGIKKWTVRIKKGGKVWDKFYGPSGKLLSVRQVPELSEFSDSKGSYYFIETNSTGLAIRKNELTRIGK